MPTMGTGGGGGYTLLSSLLPFLSSTCSLSETFPHLFEGVGTPSGSFGRTRVDDVGVTVLLRGNLADGLLNNHVC